MKTWGFKTIHVKKNERAVLLRNGDFERILEPGQHRVWAWGDALQADVFALEVSAFVHPLGDYLMAHRQEVLAQHFVQVRASEREAALIIEDGCLAAILPPAARALYWRGLREIEVRILPLGDKLPDDLRVEPELLARIRTAMQRQHLRHFAPLVAEVAQFHTGLLWVDGQLVASLPPGVHGFWQFGRNLRIEQVDLRTQSLEVSGQDILTRDKVGLRLNLAAVWRYSDVQAAFARLPKPAEHIYRELQFALRAAVGQRTLDALLDDKTAIDSAVQQAVGDKLAACGIALEGVGVKDIILPGQMRDILAQVVEAEKAAQANVIRRREETAATRSLLNTAKVMEDNPVALRMKELETLERVAERIDKISVVGGLDQVLNGLVRLR